MAIPAFKLNPPSRTIISRKQAAELFNSFANVPWKSLTFGGCAIGDAAMGVVGPLLNDLAAMESVQHLDFSDCIASLDEDEALRSLSSLSSSIGQWKGLVSVDVSANALGTKGMAACEALFKGQSLLQHIFLLENGLAGESARLLTSYFTPGPPTSLRTIHIHNNCLESYGLTVLVPLIENSPQLSSLRLSSLRSGPDGTLAVIRALKAASHLTELNISDNSLNDLGAQLLASTLSTMPNMTKLVLADSDIVDDSLALILASLSESDCPLTHLDISGNELTENAATTICDIISSKSTTLRVLDLSNNELEDSGIRSISAAISTSSVLLNSLSVHTTNSTTLALLELASVMKRLPSLESFDIDGNFISEPIAQRIAEVFGPILGTICDMEEVDEADEDGDQVQIALQDLINSSPVADTEADEDIEEPVRRQGWFSLFRGRGPRRNSKSPLAGNSAVPSDETDNASESTQITAESPEQLETANEAGASSEPSVEQETDIVQQASFVPGRETVGSEDIPIGMSTSVASSSPPNAASAVGIPDAKQISVDAVFESAVALKNSCVSLSREVAEVKDELELSTPATRRRLDFARLRDGELRSRDDYLLVDEIKPSTNSYAIDFFGGLLIAGFVVILVLAIAQSLEENTFTYRPV